MKKQLITVLLLIPSLANALELVTDKEIKENIDRTKIVKLSNGIPVIYRYEPSSDIVQTTVSFDWALKDQRTGTKLYQIP